MKRILLAMSGGLILCGLALTCAALAVSAPSALGSYEADPPIPSSPPPNPPGATPGSDGVWVVGRELKPGVYTARVFGDLCAWVRLSGFGLRMDDIIDLGEGSQGETLRVRVRATDRGFESHGCGTWQRVLR
jgi:hypothetical protein